GGSFAFFMIPKRSSYEEHTEKRREGERGGRGRRPPVEHPPDVRRKDARQRRQEGGSCAGILRARGTAKRRGGAGKHPREARGRSQEFEGGREGEGAARQAADVPREGDQGVAALAQHHRQREQAEPGPEEEGRQG